MRTDGGSELATWTEDGAPRFDEVPRAEVARRLGITEEELERLMAQGFELVDVHDGENNQLVTAAELAAECGVTTRQLRNLEERGLPSVGQGRAKRFPWPLAEEWYRVFTRRSAELRAAGGSGEFAIRFLDPLEAHREYQAAMPLARAYHHLRLGLRAPPDPAAAARLGEARRHVAAGEVPPYAFD